MIIVSVINTLISLCSKQFLPHYFRGKQLVRKCPNSSKMVGFVRLMIFGMGRLRVWKLRRSLSSISQNTKIF